MSDNKTPLEAFFFRDFSKSFIPQILKEIYIDKVYHPFFIGKRDLTILDVGQNLGLTSYYFKDYGTVIGLEPSTQHREACEAMLKENNITNVQVLPYALSNENGKAKFYLNPQNNTTYSLNDAFSTIPGAGIEEVETITFDSLFEKLKLEKVDFVKLDTEGSEDLILASDGFAKVASKIKTMVIEYHTWSKSSQSNIEHCLQDLGFETHRLQNEANLISAVRI